jgi:N6-L-threonylcarbamoyladenine synthase
MLVLGIETSCDDACVAIVSQDKNILANIRHTQTDTHMPFGGVVPELAARDHVLQVPRVYQQALEQANVHPSDIDYIAVTAAPGLMGSLMVGVSFAKALAFALDKPFIAVNHLMAHALTVRLTDDVAYPYLLVLASGGHTMLAVIHGPTHADVLGETLDDAAGEAFDKLAKTLGVYGGKAVEELALHGDDTKIILPLPRQFAKDANFSFAGLKNAVRLKVLEQGDILDDAFKANICASFQKVVAAHLINRLEHALIGIPDVLTVVVSGGVASNTVIRRALEEMTYRRGLRFVAPPIPLCTDNGAMVAWCGVELAKQGITHSLDTQHLPRMRLDETF